MYFFFIIFHYSRSAYHPSLYGLFQNFGNVALQLPLNLDFWIIFWNTASLPTSLEELSFLEFFSTIWLPQYDFSVQYDNKQPEAFMFPHYIDSTIETLMSCPLLCCLPIHTNFEWFKIKFSRVSLLNHRSYVMFVTEVVAAFFSQYHNMTSEMVWKSLKLMSHLKVFIVEYQSGKNKTPTCSFCIL